MKFRFDEEEPLPERLDALSQGERLVLGGFRRWVLGLRTGDARQWERAWSDFCFEFGTHAGRDATAALSAMITAIGRGARRPMRHHESCCPYVTADEVALTSLIAALQREDAQVARRLAAWMVRGDVAPTLLAAATALADRMSEAGILLPDRRYRLVPIPASNAGPRLAAQRALA